MACAPQFLYGVQDGVSDTAVHGGEQTLHSLDAVLEGGLHRLCGLPTSGDEQPQSELPRRRQPS